MLQKILGVITRPPVPLICGTLLAVIVVWFGGGLLQDSYGWPETSTIVVLCVLVIVLVVAFVVLRSVRARAKARSIENEIRAQAQVQAETLPPSSRSEIEELQGRFDEALDSLKSSKLGRGALYALPWYVIIGPPGSGKTTAITESGLNFPQLKGGPQGRGIRGLGGTRNCDWWFTDQSILLDTAGRYTTQVEDREEWIAFLGMIKRARKLKPINGVVVAIAITDLIGATEEQLEQHATTVRQRIDELVKELEVVFPVYLVFTKCDLLDGFVETFGALAKEERAQVWGATFVGAADEVGGTIGRFGTEFDQLCHRLDEERLRLLVPDRPAEQQQKILSLSLQLRAARRPLQEFVAKLTEKNPYSDASELRGFYFTSGTQEGAPIDFVLAKMSTAMGISPGTERAPTGGDDQAKSYFIRDLFAKVLYGDRELAHSSANVQKRREIGRRAVIWGSAAAAVLITVLSFLSWFGTRGLLSDFTAKASNRPQVSAKRLGGAPSADAKDRLEALRSSMIALLDAAEGSAILGPRVSAVGAAVDVYAKGVKSAFLVPAKNWVEGELEKYLADPDKNAYRKYSQLVLIYGAMDGGFASTEELRQALEEQSVWAWDPAQIGTVRDTTRDSPEGRHLEAFLRARQLDPSRWKIANKKPIYEQAKAKLGGAGFQGEVAQMLEKNPEMLQMTNSDLVEAVAVRVEQAGGEQVDREQKSAEITAMRKAAVIGRMAAIRLADAGSLERVRDSLSDLDETDSQQMVHFGECLDTLRRAGSISQPGRVRDAYQKALKKIAELREPVAVLLTQRKPGEYLMPEILEGTPQWMQQFAAKWAEVQHTVKTEIQQLRKSLDAEQEVVEPLLGSINAIYSDIANALAAEAYTEARTYWQTEVGSRLGLALQRFPCSGDLTHEDLKEADFVELFGPDQRIAKTVAAIHRLQKSWTIGGQLELSDEFDEFVERAEAVRGSCFRGDAAREMHFRIQDILIEDPVTNATLVIPGADGQDVVSKTDDLPSEIRNKLRRWPFGTSGAVFKLDADFVGGSREFAVVGKKGDESSHWSLLRVISRGDSVPVDDQVKVTWEIEYENADRSKGKLRSWFKFAAVDGALPLMPGFFQLQPPTKIFRDEPQ
ncbi:MAG: type VI secretion system membrane subunit TssM [bacterium]|nr:type VI secretion system membrane subunit TssM [bacterium]